MTTILATLGVALFVAAVLSALVRYGSRTDWDRCYRLDGELSHRDRDVQP